MKQFLLLFVGAKLEPRDQSAQTQEYMQRWKDWMSKLAANGTLVAGFPLEWGGKVVKQDSASDLVLNDLDVGGYMVINAASLDDAIAIARQAPHVALGGTTIVRPGIEVAAAGPRDGAKATQKAER